MDKEAAPKDVFSIGLKFCLIGNSITILFLVVNHFLALSLFIDDLTINFFIILFNHWIFYLLNLLGRNYNIS